MDDVPQELKDWAASPDHKLEDPFAQEWYKLPVSHPGVALKIMSRRIQGRDEVNSHPVRHYPVRNAAGQVVYYIGQDPDTKCILWGTPKE